MIDFHSHFLPNMDDGSNSVNESLQMLKLSYEMGIDTIISSSHYYSNDETIDCFLKRRDEKQKILLHKLNGINDVPHIVMGAEVAYFSGMSREKDISKLCIGDTNYMLLEMPFYEWSSLTINEVVGLLKNRGITPIIAHIERYLRYLRKNKRLEELLDLGVVVQASGESVIDACQRPYILKLLGKNKIHLMGSDCHNMLERPPNLDMAFKIISKQLGNSALKKIEYNGRSILNSDLIS